MATMTTQGSPDFSALKAVIHRKLILKLNLDRLSPYDPTLYLDADTRVRGDIGAPFAALADGWDLAIAPSPRQHSDALGNCSEPDRQATWEECGCNWLLALQGGALWFCKSEPILRLFAAWREEWARYKSKDQAALLRALWRAPVRVWLLGGDYNGGQLVSHLYGRAAR